MHYYFITKIQCDMEGTSRDMGGTLIFVIKISIKKSAD